MRTCNGLNASLPCLHSVADGHFLTGELTEGEGFWLGLAQQDSSHGASHGWAWLGVGCDTIIDTMWAYGEPNDYLGIPEDCAAFGVLPGGEVYDAPCFWGEPRCICELGGGSEAGRGAGGGQVQLPFLVKVSDGERTPWEMMPGVMDTDAAAEYILGKAILTFVVLATLCAFSCCLFCAGCPWHTHVRSAAAAARTAPRHCWCWPSRHQEARAVHKGVRVRTEPFNAIRGVAALQVSLGHFFTFHASAAIPGIDLGGGNAVTIFFVMSGASGTQTIATAALHEL
jgi:hypothetical protein